jgi:hypothetical protein
MYKESDKDVGLRFDGELKWIRLEHIQDLCSLTMFPERSTALSFIQKHNIKSIVDIVEFYFERNLSARVY